MKPMTPPTHYAKYDEAARHLEFQQNRLERQRNLIYADTTVVLNSSLLAFHNLPEIHYLTAAYAIALEDFALARTHLHYSVIYRDHIFAMAGLPAGETVGFQPPDYSVMVGSGTTGPVRYTTHRAWLDAFALAIYIGYDSMAQRLLSFQGFSFGTNQTEANPVFEPWVALYRATIEQPANLQEVLIAAVEAADAQQGEFYEELAFRVIPNFKIYAAVGAVDQQRFTQAVDEANEAHLQWFTKGDRPGNAPALLNLHTAAMVKLGQQRGLVAPESPYYPELGPLDPSIGIPGVQPSDN